MKKIIIFSISILSLLSFTSFNFYIGEVIDSHNGVAIYYNGDRFTNVSGRNVTADGYNLGLKYQCVEFVKRYYYEVFDHKMPNSYGHAKDLFDDSLGDVGYNRERALTQFRNVRSYPPKANDILIYGAYPGNPFGHVAIISKVENDYIEIVQQNIGSTTRKKIKLVKFMDYYTIADHNILGWLRYNR